MRLPKHIWKTLSERGWNGMHHLSARDEQGVTPLAIAFSDKHDLTTDPALVRTLLQAEADPFVLDNQGRSLWFYAHDVLTAGPLLMELGVDINQPDKNHVTFPNALLDEWDSVAYWISQSGLYAHYKDPLYQREVIRHFIEWKADLAPVSTDTQRLIQSVLAEMEQQHLQTALSSSLISPIRGRL